METQVQFHPYQGMPYSELNAMEGYVRDSIDRIVRELIFDEGRFTGLNVVKVDALNIKIGKGAYYRDGAVYAQAVETPYSLVSLVPSTGSRIVLVVVSGSEGVSPPQNVRFLVDPTPSSNNVQVRPASTRKFRQASVELVAGPASAAPSRPALPAGAIVVAAVTLAPSGIVDDPVMETANSAISLEKAMTAIALIQAQNKGFVSLFGTIRSEIAGLAKTVAEKADRTSVYAALDDVLIIKERLDIPDTAAIAGYDDFASATETDLTKSTAVVEAGFAKFGPAERKSQLIQLLNPNDPKLDIYPSGLVLPKSTDEIRIDSADRESSIAISSYGITTQTLKQLKRTRSYYWYQEKAPYAELEAKLRQKEKVRVRDAETDAFVDLDLRGADWELVPRGFDQLPGNSPFYRIDVSSATWSVGQTVQTITGSRCGQTILCAQDGWHRRIDILFDDVGATGDVHLAVCRVMPDGISPDYSRVIATTTKAVSTIKKGWVTFSFDPFFWSRGERYIIVPTSVGNHVFAISKTNDYANGTLALTTDGEYWRGELEKDLCVRVYGCKFAATSVTVDLADITLAGGVRQLEAILTGFQPKGADLVLRGRIAGVTRTIGQGDATILATAPTQIPLQATFSGTNAVMPGLELSKSRIIASRPLTTCTHVSAVRTLPTGVTTATVKDSFDTVGFDESIHVIAGSILHGSGYATQTNFTSYSRKEIKPGRHRHFFTVAGLPNIGAYQIKAVRTTANAARTFNLDARKDYGL